MTALERVIVVGVAVAMYAALLYFWGPFTMFR